MRVFERVRNAISERPMQNGHAVGNRRNIVALRAAKKEIEKMLHKHTKEQI